MYYYKFYRAANRDAVANHDKCIDAGVFTPYQAAQHCKWLQGNNRGAYVYFIRGEYAGTI